MAKYLRRTLVTKMVSNSSAEAPDTEEPGRYFRRSGQVEFAGQSRLDVSIGYKDGNVSYAVILAKGSSQGRDSVEIEEAYRITGTGDALMVLDEKEREAVAIAALDRIDSMSRRRSSRRRRSLAYAR